MKTTLDIPDEVAAALQRRADAQGRGLADEAVHLLRRGLGMSDSHGPEPSAATTTVPPVMRIHPLTQLPYFECAPDAPARGMTAAQLIALEQATQTEEDLERLGLSPRQ